MKFIISESQYKILKESSKKTRSEKLILSLYNQDKTIGMIKTITGFNLNLIIETLKDVFIIENFNCQQMKDLFYHYIFGSELIKKSYTYNDGSMVDVFYHHFDGTLSFNYYVEDRWVSGYATFLYEGECEIPFDGSYYGNIIKGKRFGDSTYYDYNLDSINLFRVGRFNKIKTISDLINFFNNDYYELIKPKLSITDKFYQELK
jgi:hypothetical protein